MIISRADIWLVNFNPIKKSNEVGKTRPALVLQNNELNSGGYPTTIVLPLTTDLIDDSEPLRYRVLKRDKLKKDSDILIAHIRSIDNSRFIEKLSSLNEKEMNQVKNFIDEITT
jgi:mRNA interferase MazF